MRFENPFERITFLLCLLCDTRDDPGVRDFTIEDVSKSFGIPIQVIRNDIAAFLSKPIFNEFSFDVNAEDLSDNIDFNFLNNNEEEYYDFHGIPCIEEDEKKILETTQKQIKEGLFDDVRIVFERNPFGNDTDEFLVPVSRNELNVIDKLNSNSQPLYITKEMPPNAGREMERKIRIINEAIRNNRVIRFSYNKQGIIKTEIKMRPSLIRMNAKAPKNAICIASNGVLWKIKQMENITERGLDQNYQEPERPDLNDDWVAIWGLPSDKNTIEGTMQHVILEIETGETNVLDKIKADVKRRENGILRIKDNHTYIYEDNISGFNDFRVWLWGYGSSIKVIEPVWLAKRIKSDYDKIRRQYECKDFLND